MPERGRQHEYWNDNLDAANLGGENSESPESLVSEMMFSSVPDIEQMIAAVEPAPGKRVLEIGCGLGANAVLLSHKGATVIAMDLSHDRLAAMRSRTTALPARSPGKILPIKARAEALPFRDASLDGACSRAVLIHTELDATCTEVERALKPAAPIAFSEPMAHNPLVNLYRWTLAPKEWRKITSYFTRREIAQVQKHFTDTDARRFYVLSFLSFVFQYALRSPMWFYTTLHRMMRLDNSIGNLWSGYYHFAWFVLITGKKRQP